MSTTTEDQESLATQAIMFADVSGSSALYKEQGNVVAKQLIDTAVNLMCDITRGNHGTVVKTIGDEVMARFDDPEDACKAATAIQQRCREETRNQAGVGLAIRIGMDYGHALLEDGDAFGDTVNDAAYVAKIARANQIVITENLVEALSPSLRADCQEFDRVNIKGESSTSVIYRFIWESPSDENNATTVMPVARTTQRVALKQLQLEYQEQLFVVTADDLPFVIGRDHRTAHLPIDSSLASRDHCHIELSRGKFVLIDHSTNGTYVKTPEQPEIYLRREELPLMGEGTITLGRRADQAPELTIRYRI